MALSKDSITKLTALINQAEANGETPDFIQNTLIPAFKAKHDAPEKQENAEDPGFLNKAGSVAKDIAVGFANNPIGRGVFAGLDKLTGNKTEYVPENPNVFKGAGIAGEIAASAPTTIAAPELAITKAPRLLKLVNAAIKGGASMAPTAAESAVEGKPLEAASEIGTGAAFGGGLSVLGSGMAKGGKALLNVAKDKIGMPTRLGAHVAGVNPRALNDIVTGKVPYSEVKKITNGGDIGYEQGQKLKATLADPELFAKNRKIVNKALEQMPDFDLTPTVDRIDALIKETPKFSAGGKVVAHLKKLKDQLVEMKTPSSEGIEKDQTSTLWDWAKRNKVNNQALEPYTGIRTGETAEFIKIKSKAGMNETQLAEKFASDFPDIARSLDIVDDSGLLTNTSNLLELLADPKSAKKTVIETMKQGDVFFNPIQDMEPNVLVSAKKYKEMRTLLDSEIDWNQPHAAALDQKLMSIRKAMKDDLIATAEDAGVGKEYVSAMKNWANNIDLVSELRKRVSTNPQAFMTNVINGTNKSRDKILLKALDDMTGENFTGEAQKIATTKGLGLSESKKTLFGITNAANGMMLAGGGLGAAIGGKEGGWKGSGVGAAAGALAFSPLGVYSGLRAGNAIRKGLGKGLSVAGSNLEGLQGVNKATDKTAEYYLALAKKIFGKKK